MKKMREAGLRFSSLRADDLLAISTQSSQALTLGVKCDYTHEEAEELASYPVAWAAWHGARLIACFGIGEIFEGRHGVGWAVLASGIGAAHLELTRFVRSQIEGCGLSRLEVMARAPDLEEVLARHPGLDAGQVAALAMSVPTPEMRWAHLLGLTPVHLLRRYGADGGGVMLFERISSGAAAMLPGAIREAA